MKAEKRRRSGAIVPATRPARGPLQPVEPERCTRAALRALMQRRHLAEAFTGRRRQGTAYQYQRAWCDFALFRRAEREGDLRRWAEVDRVERRALTDELLAELDEEIADITLREVQAWVEAMLSKPMRGRDGRKKVGLEGSTINARLAALHHLLRTAVRLSLVGENVARAELIDRRRTSRRYAPRGPDRQAVQELIDSIEGEGFVPHRDRVLIRLLADMGLRREEASELRAESFAKAEEDDGWALTITRKEDKTQTVLVPRHLEGLIREYVEGWGLGEWLFPVVGSEGRPGASPLSPHAISQIVRARSAAHGTRLSPHALRHAFVTAVLDAGATLADVQRFVGHADPRTTVRYRDDRLSRDTCPAELLAEV